ncbi:hypothetical protein AX15_003644 [Amanita polypyramis BW_CC]|nr:hypothetical protein AX15_003644 [Amanita polypyramis BW_CC]
MEFSLGLVLQFQARSLLGIRPSHPPYMATTKALIKASTMAVKTYTWISLWFLISAPVIFWDVGYCFMRPRSMRGGDLHWLWKPYSIYQDIDLVYGLPSLQDGDGFPNAQSLLNVIETLMNLAYVYLAHVAEWPGAPLIGFSSAVMTLSKTVLYWTQEYYCNYCAVGHNTLENLIIYWIIPNGLWIVIPSLIVKRLGTDLAVSLIRTSAAPASVLKKKN